MIITNDLGKNERAFELCEGVIELLFQRVIFKLKEDNCDLTASQLAAFVAAVTPYAIAKSGDGKKNPNNLKIGMYSACLKSSSIKMKKLIQVNVIKQTIPLFEV